jgi:hypothetical protein
MKVYVLSCMHQPASALHPPLQLPPWRRSGGVLTCSLVAVVGTERAGRRRRSDEHAPSWSSAVLSPPRDRRRLLTHSTVASTGPLGAEFAGRPHLLQRPGGGARQPPPPPSAMGSGRRRLLPPVLRIRTGCGAPALQLRCAGR